MKTIKLVGLVGLLATHTLLHAQITFPSGGTNDGDYTNVYTFTPMPYVPGLKLAVLPPVGTNLFLNLLEADPAGTYDIFAASNLVSASWNDVLGGTNGQTNFTLPIPFAGTGFFRAARMDMPVTNTAGMTASFPDNDVNTSLTSASISGGVAAALAVLVNDTNLADAIWVPFSAIPNVLLGTNDGTYQVMFGFIGADGQTNWTTATITLDTTPPQLTITNPTTGTVSVPMIQLQGYASEDLSSLTFDVSNAGGVITNQTGYWQPVFYDTNQLAFTTNSFQCYDIPLTNGVNTITLHATDLAGNTTTTNISYTLDYSGDTTAPALSVTWPQNGTAISGSNFTFQGLVDDATATVMATIADGGGDTNTVQGLVERDGKVSIGNLPLAAGTNTLTIIATDAAGNASTNSLTVYQSSVTVTLNPLSSDQANQSSVSVTGTISDPSGNVCIQVNGTTAYYLDDVGDWEADGVPVSANGAASLDVELYTNDPVNIGSQVYVVPQPAKVGLMSYDGHQYSAGASTGGGSYVDISPWDEEAADSAHWTFQDGGEDFGYTHYSGSPYPYEPGYDGGWDDTLSAGDGGFHHVELFFNDLGTWENVDLDTGGGPTAARPTFSWSESDQTQTRVMIEPAKPAAAGAMVNYIVGAQAWDEESEVQLASSAVQVRGVPLTELTNSDGSVWGYMTFSAPAGAMPDVTPKATGNYTFNAQTVKTKEDWQAEVRQEIDADSGVKIENYLAGNGFLNNRANIQAVYAFYQKLFTEQPTEFYWAGLAKLAGAPVYAGLSDAQYLKNGGITDSILTLDLSSAVLAYKAGQFQTDLIQMNIDIYSDLDWQFEAYKNGGLDALEEIYAADTTHAALDLNAITAWQEIDDGIQNNDDAEIQDGNTLLAQREQKQVLVEDYEKLSDLFPGTSSVMSRLAQNPVIGGPDFLTLEPGGDLANTDTRWDWVSRSYTSITNTGIFPLWLQEADSSRLLDVETPLLTRALQFSYVYNDISTSLTLY